MEAVSNEGAVTLAPVVEEKSVWTEKLSDFPKELRERKIWCVWRMALREGQNSKVPYQASGFRAKSNDPTTWCSWDEACKAADADPELGVGLFTDGTFTFVDCDHCADAERGEIIPWAQEVLSRVSSYSEYSPSGEGLHSFVLGAVSPAIKKNDIEMYSRGRFATVTGERLPDAPSDLRQIDVESLRRDVAEGKVGSQREKFERLWAGDAEYIAEHYRSDESAADQALANLLAMEFRGNYEAIEAAFSESALGQRDKWCDREDYRRRTITKAIDWYEGSTGGGEKSHIETVSPEHWEALFHTIAEFENAPPLRFAIDGFLQEQGITFLGGLPGHGKTLLMLNMVKALLEGGNLFEGYAGFQVLSPSKRVIYLTPEVSITPFRDRLKLFNLLEHVKDKRLFVSTLSAKELLVNLQDARFMKAVEGAHIFLDTAIRFMPGDENTASENAPWTSVRCYRLAGVSNRLTAEPMFSR